MSEVFDLYARHVNPQFVKLLGVLGYGRVFTRALGTRLWDSEGREYLDFLSGFGATSLGHNHPKLIARVKAHLDSEALGFALASPSPQAAALGAALAKRLPAPLEVSTFLTGGGEAVEAAMKLARAATKRSGFLFCEGGFHGNSFGTLSIMGAARMRAPFEPLLAGCESVPFGDEKALERALAKRTFAAFVVEPILGEGGVVIPPAGWLARAKALCEEHGTLLVADEVQTGIGRTGSFLASEITPDAVVLAKGLSGGLVPVSAVVTSRDLHERAFGTMDRFDACASTFGGNALSCAAALATLEIVDDERLVERAKILGERMLSALRFSLKGHPLVKEIRGRGLLVAVELGPTEQGLLARFAPGVVEQVAEKVYGQWAALKLLERGVLAQPASHRWNVLKLLPPLIATEEEIDRGVDAVVAVLREYESVGKVLLDAGKRVGSRARKRFALG